MKESTKQLVLKIEKEINGRKHIGWEEAEDNIQEEIREAIGVILEKEQDVITPQAGQVTDAVVETALDAYYGEYPWREQDEDASENPTFKDDMRRALEAALAAQPQAQPPQESK